MAELASDLLAYIDASPSPHHAVAETARRLERAGFSRLSETEVWSLTAGEQRYVVRDGSSIVAFRVGADAPSSAGVRLIGAHTDSPTFKVRPSPDVERRGRALVGVEVYGSPLTYTWLDRDLTLAGRVIVRRADGDLEQRLVHLPGAPLRIPSLAIHLQRELREEGLKLNAQRDLVPVWGSSQRSRGLLAAVAEAAGVTSADVLGHDLVCADTQPAALVGGDGYAIAAPRLDNLGSCHAGLTALVTAEPAPQTQLLVANDHEEVGSGSAEGAGGSFLADVLARLVSATEGDARQALPVTLARSRLVSADMAHAVHPNRGDRHEPEHAPELGGGPVLKVNANQSYATDGASSAWFTACCQDAGVGLQRFVTRGDLPCGGTIGPLTATRTGIPTVDVGTPMLAMHAIRETADARDVAPMIAALRAHFERPAGGRAPRHGEEGP